MEFRTLKANEIECRIGTINEKGLSLLLYQNARAAMDLLDETVGAENWQRKHELINDNLFCSIGINVNYKSSKEPLFIWKQDVGVESYTEKEKGQASDSFKRAAVNWGIGRELYTAPFIWIPAGQYNLKKGRTDRPATYDKFVVSSIEYSGKAITSLEIVNENLFRTVYKFSIKNEKPKTEKKENHEKKPVKIEDNGYPERNVMLNLAKEKYPDGSKQLKALLECWKIDNIDKASTAQLMVIWGKYGVNDEN